MATDTTHIEIRTPGSVSNLGPGFDTLAVAVRLYTCVRVVELRPETPDTIETTFIGGPFAGENRIETAFRRARAVVGAATPGVRIEVRSDVPRRAGLGSSAAAAVAGLKLYEALTAPRPAEDWLAIATAIEGHPDNAAAALFGGLTASCQHDDGRVTASVWNCPDDLAFVVATPDVPLDTAYARSLVPAQISMQDAVFNLQRVVLLLRALDTGDRAWLREGLRDRWHQPYRAPQVPALAEALALDHPSLLGVFLSGAGPSIAALATRHGAAEVKALLDGLYERMRIGCTIRILQPHPPAAGRERISS
jgi:homoserine kinase